MVAAREAEKQAAVNTEECRQLAQSIQDARHQPTRAVLASRRDKQMAQRIMGSASQANLPADFVVRIDPGHERRVADTDYVALPTTVQIEGATLAQLVTFFCQLSLDDPDLQVSSLDLHAPRDQGTEQNIQEPWNANLTLTYWRFAPKSTPAQR